MSWLFSRALVEASSAVISSDGGLYAPLSAIPTPPPFSPLGKTTQRSHPFPSGMTCEPLTADRGEAVLTWCLAASPVRTSPAPATGQASPEPVRASGGTWRGSSVRWDRDSCSWKTVPSSPGAASESFSGTWPRWGTMHNGACSEQLTPARLTSASGSGSWHTPTAKDRFGSTPKETAMMVAHLAGAQVASTYKRLRSQVAAGMWPTPMAHDGKDCGSSPSQAGRNSPTLPVAAGGRP